MGKVLPGKDTTSAIRRLETKRGGDEKLDGGSAHTHMAGLCISLAGRKDEMRGGDRGAESEAGEEEVTYKTPHNNSWPLHPRPHPEHQQQ